MIFFCIFGSLFCTYFVTELTDWNVPIITIAQIVGKPRGKKAIGLIAKGTPCTWTSPRWVGMIGLWRLQDTMLIFATGSAIFPWLNTWMPPITPSYRPWSIRWILQRCPEPVAYPLSYPPFLCSTLTSTKRLSWRTMRTWWWRTAAVDDGKSSMIDLKKKKFFNKIERVFSKHISFSFCSMKRVPQSVQSFY